MTNLDFTAIVFSKNRPMQLFALLESMFVRTDIKPSNVIVVTKMEHDYVMPYFSLEEEITKKYGKGLNIVQEYSFKEQVLKLLTNSNSFVSFFTDDDVFKSQASLDTVCKLLKSNPQILTFSLRLGQNLNFCHSVQKPQAVPTGIQHGMFFFYNWRGTDWDWGYPLSVDGHVFRRDEILQLASSCGNWHSPNTFEGALSQLHPYIPSPQMSCYMSSVLFNIPHNQVNVDVDNFNAGNSEKELLELWLDNKKIDISTFHNIKNTSAHQMVSFKFIKRK